ncbi:unnamed protein product [Closterium sp. NIES-53]
MIYGDFKHRKIIEKLTRPAQGNRARPETLTVKAIEETEAAQRGVVRTAAGRAKTRASPNLQAPTAAEGATATKGATAAVGATAPEVPNAAEVSVVETVVAAVPAPAELLAELTFIFSCLACTFLPCPARRRAAALPCLVRPPTCCSRCPPAAHAARLLLTPPACCPHAAHALPARQRATLPSTLACPAAQRASTSHCPARQRAPLPNEPARPAAQRASTPRYPACQRALLPNLPAYPAAQRASAPRCPARQRALLPSALARPAAQRPARPSAQRPVPCPARAARACPAHAPVPPAAAALGFAALGATALGAAACCCCPWCHHLLLHTLLPCVLTLPARSCPAPRALPTATAALG